MQGYSNYEMISYSVLSLSALIVTIKMIIAMKVSV